jgi:hypothetical protein
MEVMMELTNERRSSERRGTRLTKAGGWLAIAFGAIHVVVASLDTSDTWSQVADDGWWNAFTLDESTSWIGWLTLAWGLPFAITLPASPGWAIPLIGGLIVLGDRRRSVEAGAQPQVL